METIQMDIMQAQIGSLATDVSRLEAKVGNGGGALIVDFTLDNDDPTTGTSSKTTQEIADAWRSGMPVYGRIHTEGLEDPDDYGDIIFTIQRVTYNPTHTGNEYEATFASIAQSGHLIIHINIDYDTRVNVETVPIPE